MNHEIQLEQFAPQLVNEKFFKMVAINVIINFSRFKIISWKTKYKYLINIAVGLHICIKIYFCAFILIS